MVMRMGSRDTSYFIKTLIRIGASSLKLLDKTEKWIHEFFQKTGKDKLEHLFKIATLASKSQRSPADIEVLKMITEFLEGASFLGKKRGLENWGAILEQEALGVLTALAYKLIPSFAQRMFLEPEALKEEVEEL